MQKPQKRLGKGLEALITATDQSAVGLDTKPPETTGTITSMIGTDHIRSNPFQPRKDIRPEQLKSLADSIMKTGVIQPIAVRPTQGDGPRNLNHRIYHLLLRQHQLPPGLLTHRSLQVRN